MGEKALFDEFSEMTTTEWISKITQDLKGADYDETLVWKSPEGVNVKPFYDKSDVDESLKVPIPICGWKIGHYILVEDVKSANENAINAIKCGAESIVFCVSKETQSGTQLLSEINLKEITVYFNLQFSSIIYIKTILDFAGKGGQPNVFFNIDVLGDFVKTGNWNINEEEDFNFLNKVISLNSTNSIQVDTSQYQNAGGNIVQQLAYSLNHANEYLNYFNENNILDKVESITFKVAIGSNYFFEIAKLRAFRLLWKTLVAAYNMPIKMHIVAIPTKRNKTLYDYNVNMLRTTSETMSSVLGGADMICNQPYDAIFHKSNDFGERIALNQLLLLKNESYFDKVSNAAEGSYYIEAITQNIANKAFLLFKEIEEKGGFISALKQGEIQNQIKNSAQKERERFNTKQEVLVGTNKYQNTADKMKNDLEIHSFQTDVSGDTCAVPISESRLAEEVELELLRNE